MRPHPSSRAGARARRARGLVSVPTSDTPRFASRGEARVTWEAEGIRSELSAAVQAGAAFTSQPRAERLARLRRSVGFSARILGVPERGHRPEWVVMLTVTYRPGAEWSPRHITGLMRCYREWARRRGFPCKYVWVAELQTRGAVHYHVACWLPKGVRPPKPDVQGWWKHGASNRVVARNAVPYLMKYFSKGSGALQLPKDARSYGVGGLDHAERRARRWLRLPGFIKARADIFDDWVPAKGGGWWGPYMDSPVPSEYVRAWLGDSYGLLRVADYGRPFEAHGPFTWLSRKPT